MTLPELATLFDVVAATWPAATQTRHGPWIIRDGQGGGNRVSAATATDPVVPGDLGQAETAMQGLGQTPLFMIRPGDDMLDDMLAQAGYVIRDRTNLYAAPLRTLTTTPVPPVTAFDVWPPLCTQRDLWASGGIGPARLAVMDRVQGPKTSLLGRLEDRPAGTAFVGLAHGCAMIHALEVTPHFRGQGLGRHLTQAAAFWGARNGAQHLALVTTQANVAANALYTSLGMVNVGQYHYRIRPQD